MKLNSIHIKTGTAASKYTDTRLSAYTEDEGFRSSKTFTAAELASAAFGILAAWMITKAAQGGWTLKQCNVEKGGMKHISGGEILVEGEEPTPVVERQMYFCSMTLESVKGKKGEVWASEDMPDAQRDALHALWGVVYDKVSEVATPPSP